MKKPPKKTAAEILEFLILSAEVTRKSEKESARDEEYAQALEDLATRETYEFLIAWIRGECDL